MAEAALRLASNIQYTGVGTIEFLVDQEQNFYFLEMNTRLQVEHCVTEMITGIDLVRLQIEIGSGQPFSLKQSDIQPRGHAIECRIYAEDPENNFMPSPGKIHWMRVPEGPGIRHDTGIAVGAEISIYYDPMIAKLIVYAPNRDQAIQKMICALNDYRIGGLKDNILFLKRLLRTKEFQSATMTTQFIDQHPELTEKQKVDLPLDIILGVAALDHLNEERESNTNGKASMESEWWRVGQRELLNQRL